MDYDFPNKRHYRNTVYSQCEKLADKPRRNLIVSYLDSGQGLETQFLLARGYRPENIFPCNLTPQHAAWINRRISPVRVRAFGDGVELALRTLKQEGVRPDIINLDLTSAMSRISENVFRQVSETLTAGQVVAYSLLRGRDRARDLACLADLQNLHDENPQDAALLQQFLRPDDLEYLRLSFSQLALSKHLNLYHGYRRVGFYKSAAGHQTMLFCVGKMEDLAVIKNLQTAAMKALGDAGDVYRETAMMPHKYHMRARKLYGMAIKSGQYIANRIDDLRGLKVLSHNGMSNQSARV